MDWALAIRRNRDALLAVVASIVALLGGREAVPVAGRLHSAALSLLRPAEAAVRRLIVIAARGLVVAVRKAPSFASALVGGASGVSHAPAFRLFDRARRYTLKHPADPPKGMPRIRTFWGPTPAQPIDEPSVPPSRRDPDAPIDASRLHLRLAALERALADLPRQAQRLARWRARRAASANALPTSPLRFGRPPGWRSRSPREIDLVLRECHMLALDALAPDTS